MTTLLVCSGGGHLKQLWTLRRRFALDDDVTWVTFDTGLSRSLLADEDFVVSPYAAPRDLPNNLRIARLADRMLRERDVSRVISTGASVGVAFMAPARARGVVCHYIESAARADGPSLSGRLAARIPGVRLYSQYPSWADDRWQYAGSIYDGYAVGPRVEAPETPTRVVVTLGTTESYGFRRLVEALIPLLPAGADVLWQVGATDVSGLPIDAVDTVPAADLADAVAKADLVVAHSGTGSALTAMDAGRCAVLVPRLQRHGEHVDDHQLQIAGELHRRGLAISCPAEELTHDVLREAMSRSVLTLDDPPPFVLREDGS